MTRRYHSAHLLCALTRPAVPCLSIAVAAEGDRRRCQYSHPFIEGGCDSSVLGAQDRGPESSSRGCAGARYEGGVRLRDDATRADVLPTV